MRLELSVLVSSGDLLVHSWTCIPSYIAVLLAQAESHALIREGSGQMGRLHKTLPLLRLDHVEGLRRDGLEEHDLSSISVRC